MEETFDFVRIQQSKREFRQRAAARPIEEKLAMLDALRERALAIRAAQPNIVRPLKTEDQKSRSCS